jgi:YebC/PmpR family DNA-binding regulatory protein
MAGHSPWANIERSKSKVDKRRGIIFSKWAKLIMAAARTGGADPSANLKLRYAIDRARADNMPKDSIERAIKKGAGELSGPPPEEVLYEAYAPGGVALLIEALTDNRARTAPNLRSTLTKRGGSLANAGAVQYMFAKKAVFAVKRAGVDEEAVMECALENGADDVDSSEPEIYGIAADPAAYHKLKEALEARRWELLEAAQRWVPGNLVPVAAADAEALQALLDALEEDEDVQAVHHNADFQDA